MAVSVERRGVRSRWAGGQGAAPGLPGLRPGDGVLVRLRALGASFPGAPRLGAPGQVSAVPGDPCLAAVVFPAGALGRGRGDRQCAGSGAGRGRPAAAGADALGALGMAWVGRGRGGGGGGRDPPGRWRLAALVTGGALLASTMSPPWAGAGGRRWMPPVPCPTQKEAPWPHPPHPCPPVHPTRPIGVSRS